MALQRLPEQIAGAPMRTVRPLMLRGLYANPEKELVRLNRAGVVTRIAPGTYPAKPDSIPASVPPQPPAGNIPHGRRCRVGVSRGPRDSALAAPNQR